MDLKNTRHDKKQPAGTEIFMGEIALRIAAQLGLEPQIFHLQSDCSKHWAIWPAAYSQLFTML